MNRREQRIAKIAQALLDENLVGEASSSNDDDFESVSESSQSTGSSSSSAIDFQKYDENLELTEASDIIQEEKSKPRPAYVDPAKAAKETAKAKKPLLNENEPQPKPQQTNESKKNQSKKDKSLPLIPHAQSAAELLQQKLSGVQQQQFEESTTQTQPEKKRITRPNFRLSDEEFLNHLAVTYVWNVLSYKDNQKTVAQDTQLQQQLFDEQLHLKTFSTTKPFHSLILAESRELVFDQILSTHFTLKQKRFLLECIQKRLKIEDFNMSAEAKQMPGFLDYKQLLDCYWNSYCYLPSDMVQFFEGKLIDKKRPGQVIQQQQQLLQQSNQSIGKAAKPESQLSQQQLQYNAQKSDVLRQIQEKQLLQMQKLQIPKAEKELSFNQTASKIVPTFVNRSSEGHFKVIVTKPFREGYVFVPQANSVLTQTEVSIASEQQALAHEDFVRVSLAPPKRNQVQKYFVIDGQKSNPAKMHCSLQTDVQAKTLRPNVTSVLQKESGANVTVIIDDKDHDLVATDDNAFKKALLNASEVKILRGKGRAGKRLDDFGALLQKIRPDLIKEGLEKLFIQTRVRTQQIPENDVITYKIDDGEYLTGQGMAKKPKGLYVIVDDPPKQLQLGGPQCKYVVSNGAQLQSQVERWYVLNEPAPDLQKSKFLYRHPVTNQGYNTILEYQQICAKLRQTENENQTLANDVNADVQTAADAIQSQDFAKAGELVKQSFENLLPSYAMHSNVVFDGSKYARSRKGDFVEQYSVLKRFDVVQ